MEQIKRYKVNIKNSDFLIVSAFNEFNAFMLVSVAKGISKADIISIKEISAAYAKRLLSKVN